MSKSVESYYQEDGIASKNVNIKNQFNLKILFKRKETWWAVIISIVVACISGIKYIIDNNSNDKHVIVTSHNQSGGITAYNVNIDGQPRRFNQEYAKNLRLHLPNDRSKKVLIIAQMGDKEAFQFASEIKEYLESEGWHPGGVDLFQPFDRPIGKQSVRKREDGGIDILIGPNK